MDMDLEEIAYALSGFPRERVAEAVERVLNTADPVLVSDLVDALRWCGVDPPTPTPIKRLLLSTDVRAKAWARRALEDWGY
jgi:hypothetical protein